MNSIADGVFTVDMEWNVTFFNKSAERITGIPAAEALGRKCWEVFRSSLCDGRCALAQCMSEGANLSNVSIFIIRSDGTKVPVSISAAPLHAEDGSLLGGVETFRDLTDVALLRKEVEARFSFEDIVGKSRAMTSLFDLLPRIARSDATVLVTGESGTGKELVARALHSVSPRETEPFVAVNCGALPDTLLESELFGYKAGAFTDAKGDKPGRFALAGRGTIFLDEVAELSPAVQVKLLRVLQERVYEPLGSTAPERTEARVVAATNRDLDELAASGAFRQDLFYRLNVARIHIPPLRERPEDVPLLVAHFVSRFNALTGKSVEGVSAEVLATLLRHDFPGNVRELENILEYAFILCPGGLVQPEHLPEGLRPAARHAGVRHSAAPLTMEQIKARAAREAVLRHGGKRMAACRELGITKDTLRRLLAQIEDVDE
jgi:PAS domain S-box-containing protein